VRSNRRYKSPSKHKTWLFSSSPAPTMPVQRGFSLVANVECAADPERHEEAGGRSDQEGGVRGHPHHLLVRPSPGMPRLVNVQVAIMIHDRALPARRDLLPVEQTGSPSLECPRSPCWRTYNLASLKSESASLNLYGSGACWSLVSSGWGCVCQQNA